MGRIISAALLGLAMIALSGCETVRIANAPVSKVKMEQMARDAKLAYLGYLKIANEYVHLPRCGRPTSPKICSDQKVVDTLRKTAVMVDTATQEAENAARELDSDPTVVEALVIGAVKATNAFGTIAAMAKKGKE